MILCYGDWLICFRVFVLVWSKIGKQHHNQFLPSLYHSNRKKVIVHANLPQKYCHPKTHKAETKRQKSPTHNNISINFVQNVVQKKKL
jgi:hypothetical protein